MDTQLYTSVDLLPAMGEITLYFRSRFFKHVSQEESYDIAKTYVTYWQRNPNRGLAGWLQLNHDFLSMFGKQVEPTRNERR